MIPPFSVLKNLVKAPFNHVCCVYSSTDPTALPSVRWELFRSKHLEGEMLPLTGAALQLRIIRANYVTMQDKSYLTDCPELPSIEENGWNLLESGCYIPVKRLALPAPKDVLELIKCGCKAGCKDPCSWSINSLPCTPLCKATVETVQILWGTIK